MLLKIVYYTDVDPLACEPGVIVRLAIRPEDIADADLVILPGTRATVHDLQWLRDRGLAGPLTQRAAQGLPILGIWGVTRCSAAGSSTAWKAVPLTSAG